MGKSGQIRPDFPAQSGPIWQPCPPRERMSRVPVYRYLAQDGNPGPEMKGTDVVAEQQHKPQLPALIEA